MPEIAMFVAELRAAFGDTIDDAVARGKAGEPTFFASENGRTVGTRAMDHYNVWVADETVRDRYYCNAATVRALAHLLGATNVHNQSAAPNGFMRAEAEYRNEPFNYNDS